MLSTSAGAFLQRLRTAFPDREFIMRSQGQVRFIRISSRSQKIAAGVATGVLGAWCVSVGALALSQVSAGTAQAALAGREAKVARAEHSVEQYRENIDTVASNLARRQKFIEQMVDAHISELPEGDEAAQPQSTDETGLEAKKISAALPQAGTLAGIEARQLALVERLTRYANDRSRTATDAIRKLGLNPRAMIASGRTAEGGPLLKLATASNGSIDPRFRRMGQSLARMDALESGLASIPQVSPAHVAYVSSSYGYRSDPFTGGAAFHAGLDFPGPMGSPIYAAAKGRVTFVGQKSGYGNCVEVTHGNGLMTRYGHLSGFRAHVGQEVDAGALIAAMGSTGRSTGSHLHFEVRVNDRPVNPRPFLEAARTAQSNLQNNNQPQKERR
ncbi:peptidase M23 [Novosphingobium barchaimii LL02]|uniref:Peptidase M23 n=2 Tax=Novosphingobium barchaimii TaxID=1420591 RepID=A0A0J7XP49_9SPHN|nr:peptidoglycan DD-metalloendopeptidase family protein [Novosphingobium barchaimii]KMS52858.1 peptidase M23 [Novosphingobium barchaimii LL02]